MEAEKNTNPQRHDNKRKQTSEHKLVWEDEWSETNSFINFLISKVAANIIANTTTSDFFFPEWDCGAIKFLFIIMQPRRHCATTVIRLVPLLISSVESSRESQSGLFLLLSYKSAGMFWNGIHLKKNSRDLYLTTSPWRRGIAETKLLQNIVSCFLVSAYAQNGVELPSECPSCNKI